MPAAPPSPQALRAAVIRDATPDDIAAATAIYGHHVRHGLASFEETPPDAAEMHRRFEALAADAMPYFVATAAAADGMQRVVAFAYAGRYRQRPAYRHAVEDSVYVDPACTGHGLGDRLLAALIEAATARGFRQMLAVIGDSANRPSIVLHERHGFVRAGLLKSVGFKHGRWVDTVVMQRPLGAGDATLPG